MIDATNDSAPVAQEFKLTERQLRKFWDKVDKRGDNECWNFQGFLNHLGYGKHSLAGRLWSAHRLSWTIFYGRIPKGEGFHGTCVLHRCDNRKCVNPSHLFLGSHADNMHDMRDKGRRKGILTGTKNGTYTKPESRVRGETHGRCKIFDRDIPEIRAKTPDGKWLNRESELAAKFKVNRSQIQKIRRGQQRKIVSIQ